MTRRDALMQAYDLCDALKVALTTAAAFDGHNARRAQQYRESADVAANTIIDLIWQSGEVVTLAVPANESDDDTPPPAASAARPLILEQAA